jgi:hypothetical protein
MTPEHLRALMNNHQLNVKRTAGLMSVSVGALYHWLKGDRPISRSAWELLIVRLNKPVTITIAGDDWNIQ